MTHINHQFPIVIDNDSQILILGSIPSVISRKRNFYYMNPTNRFYQILSIIYQENFLDDNVSNKIKLLKKHHIALYDVIEECDIDKSSDSSIRNPKIANIIEIINKYPIKRIFLNGTKAYQLFAKHFDILLPMATLLPSTSAANAKCSIEQLLIKWQEIKL